VRSRPPLACGGEGRDQKAGSPGAARLRQAREIQGGWSPPTRPARRAGDEIRAPATLVEATLTRSRTRVRFPPSPLFPCKWTLLVFTASIDKAARCVFTSGRALLAMPQRTQLGARATTGCRVVRVSRCRIRQRGP